MFATWGKRVLGIIALLIVLSLLGAALAEGWFAAFISVAETAPDLTPELTLEQLEATEAPEQAAVPVPEVTAVPEPTPEPTPEITPEPTDPGLPIEPLYQHDYTETAYKVNGRTRTVSTSGCGAVCVSMVVGYLTGDTKQTPEDVFARAIERGEYRGFGLTHETLSALLAESGVESAWIPNNIDAVRLALSEDIPVVAHVGPGTFTRSGHYILLRGLTEDGEVIVNDPASEERTVETYPLETVVDEARRNNSFMLCWTGNLEEFIESPRPEPTPVPVLIAAANALRVEKDR